MEMSESSENYLESIYIIKNEKGFVRAIDIAYNLDVTKASVSNALKKLQKSNFITIDSNSHIELTPKGLEIATRIYEMHTTIADFFVQLGVDKETAQIESCKIEHILSESTFEKLKQHINEFNKQK